MMELPIFVFFHWKNREDWNVRFCDIMAGEAHFHPYVILFSLFPLENEEVPREVSSLRRVHWLYGTSSLAFYDIRWSSRWREMQVLQHGSTSRKSRVSTPSSSKRSLGRRKGSILAKVRLGNMPRPQRRWEPMGESPVTRGGDLKKGRRWHERKTTIFFNSLNSSSNHFWKGRGMSIPSTNTMQYVPSPLSGLFYCFWREGLWALHPLFRMKRPLLSSPSFLLSPKLRGPSSKETSSKSTFRPTVL